MRKLILSWLVVLSCCVGNAVLAAPQTGWWWNPTESGRGFFVESDNGITFIGAYLYDADGHATWLVSGAANPDPYNYTGQLYSMSKGQTLYGSYVAPVGPDNAGTLSVHFSDDTHGTLTWPGGTVAIERQIFDTTVAAFQPVSGWWWNPAESGSGYSVEVQGKNLFIVGFMYDDAGRPVWYFSAGPMSSDNTFHGAVLQFAGGQTMSGPYHPPGTPRTIATLDVTFKAENEAEFAFTEVAAAAQSNLRPKAGQSSTKKVQPQFPKPSIYLPPKKFAGNFTQEFKSHTASSGVTADVRAIESLDAGWDQDASLPDFSFYGITNGNMSFTYSGTSTNSGATCNHSGSTSLSLGATGVTSASSLRVGINRSYLLYVHVDEGAVSVPTTGQCVADDLVLPFTPTIPGPLIELTYEGVVVGDRISGGGIKTVVTGPVTTTWTYSWNFVGIRP